MPSVAGNTQATCGSRTPRPSCTSLRRSLARLALMVGDTSVRRDGDRGVCRPWRLERAGRGDLDARRPLVRRLRRSVDDARAVCCELPISGCGAGPRSMPSRLTKTRGGGWCQSRAARQVWAALSLSPVTQLDLLAGRCLGRGRGEDTLACEHPAISGVHCRRTPGRRHGHVPRTSQHTSGTGGQCTHSLAAFGVGGRQERTCLIEHDAAPVDLVHAASRLRAA